MDASTKFLLDALDAQETRPQQPHVVEFDDVDTIDPLRFAALLAANDRQLQTPGEAAADAIEIELTAEEMDASLEGR